MPPPPAATVTSRSGGLYDHTTTTHLAIRRAYNNQHVAQQNAAVKSPLAPNMQEVENAQFSKCNVDRGADRVGVWL